MNQTKTQYEPYYGPIGSELRHKRFFAATAEATLRFFEQPGVQEEFEAWQKEYHKTGKIFNDKLRG